MATFSPSSCTDYNEFYRLPNMGSHVTVQVLSGYRLVQDRPWDCRTVCQCGECNGVTTEHEGTVIDMAQYSDLPEAKVQCEDGTVVTLRGSYGGLIYN